MTGRAGPSYPVERVLRSSVQQHWLRGAAFAAAVVFLALVWVAGGHHPLLTALGVLVAAQAVALPETHAPLALVLYLGGLWVVVTPGRLDLWALAASVALAVVHLGCTLVAHGPPGLALEPAELRLWGVRAASCVAAGCGVWLAGRGVAALHPGSGDVAPAVALALLLAWCAVVATRVVRRQQDR